MNSLRFPLLALLTVLVAAALAGCAGSTAASHAAPAAADDDSPPAAGDDSPTDDDIVSPPAFNTALAEQIFAELGFLPYLDIKPVSSEPSYNGYTVYTFSTSDIQCYHGGPANVAVSYGASDDVMFFMEGGGASWPGYSLDIDVDALFDLGYRNRDAVNPLRDWNFVYVPYCDDSIHTGDADDIEGGEEVHHRGLRQTAAAAALAGRLFPNAQRVLVTGASAGGFGTYEGWPIVKSQFMNARTYILSDSGVGFWNPSKPGTWATIKKAWNLHVPTECAQCSGTILTYLYELWMAIDPQLKVGMFSSWHDFVISRLFLQMDKDAFAELLRDVTDEVKADYPDRFARFLISGNSHTCYEPLLPGGPNYAVDGVSLYDWIGQLVYDETDWVDHLQPAD
jgi:hypothetical protein